MLLCRHSCRLLIRSANLSKFYSIPDQRRHYVSSKVIFFTKILEFGSPSETKKFLQKNDCVMQKDQKDVFDSFNYLTNIGISVNDIRKYPNILCSEETVLRNRREIFTECGCSTEYLCFYLDKYVMISNQSEMWLNKTGVIGSEINLQRRLADCLDVQLHPCEDGASLTAIRMHFLRLFYLENNFMTAKEFDQAMRNYPNARHKSYRWIKQIVKLLIDQFRIPTDQIKDNFHVLQADPDNLQKLLTLEPIGGVTMSQILLKTPSLLSTSYYEVVRTLAELKKCGIDDELIKKCFRILTIDWKIVRNRFKEMRSRKELDAMNFHPLFLTLIMKSSAAHSRLDYLHEQGKKCFAISNLTGSRDQFVRFSSNETDRNSSRDCALFLANIFELEPKEVKNEMSKHQYWLHIPFADMKQTIKVLKREGFSLEAIATNIHIVLYSGDLILKRLKTLDESTTSEQFGGHEFKHLSGGLRLKLVLYHIEVEFHFSGDGVWLDRKSDFAD